MNARINSNTLSNSLELAVFETQIGWFTIVHRRSLVCSIQFGASSREQALQKFSHKYPDLGLDEEIQISKSVPVWQQMFVDYALGKSPSFNNVQLEAIKVTPFQESVLKQCRLIPYGSTLTYGELAAKTGAPKAARAVGATMKSNRFPIVIPCHRVIRANGIGGFSASDGVSSKRTLLMMEGAIKESPQKLLPGIQTHSDF